MLPGCQSLRAHTGYISCVTNLKRDFMLSFCSESNCACKENLYNYKEDNSVKNVFLSSAKVVHKVKSKGNE